MKTLLLALLLGLAGANPATAQLPDDLGLMEKYPDLEKFIAKERSSDLFFGFGLSPITLVNGKYALAASIFQVHYVTDPWDIELLNISFGSAFGDPLTKENFFLLRMAPKYKVFKGLSAGPLVGIEFVHFPGVIATLRKGVSDFSKPFNFSTFGYFYGGAISQTFDLNAQGTNAIRVSAIYYKEQYSVTTTSNGLNYYFDDNSLNIDSSPIAPSSMFMIEVSYLY